MAERDERLHIRFISSDKQSFLAPYPISYCSEKSHGPLQTFFFPFIKGFRQPQGQTTMLGYSLKITLFRLPALILNQSTEWKLNNGKGKYDLGDCNFQLKL